MPVGRVAPNIHVNWKGASMRALPLVILALSTQAGVVHAQLRPTVPQSLSPRHEHGLAHSARAARNELRTALPSATNLAGRADVAVTPAPCPEDGATCGY